MAATQMPPGLSLNPMASLAALALAQLSPYLSPCGSTLAPLFALNYWKKIPDCSRSISKGLTIYNDANKLVRMIF